MLWCIAGIPLTVLGGINCDIPDNNTATMVRNTCYYDAEGDKAGLYKTMSILILVVHVICLINFFFSLCPADRMKHRVKNDPAPKPAKKTAATKDTAKPSTSNADANNVATTAASAALSASDLQQAGRKRELDARAEELEKKSKRLADQQRELERREEEANRQSTLRAAMQSPAPPSYSVVMETTSNPTGAFQMKDIEMQ